LSAVFQGVLQLIGALGLFLYGNMRLGDGVQKIAGEKTRAILERQAREPLLCMLTGFGIAAALQSNVLTFGMISSMLNAGLLGLLPAIWSVFGLNLGLTLNAHLMSINFGAIAFAFLLIGFLFYSYSKRRNQHYFGQILFCLGLMYLGFNMMHQAFLQLSQGNASLLTIKSILLHPWLGFILGIALAALLRSSNIVVVLTQGLVGVTLGLVAPRFLAGTIAMIIGANVGKIIINMLAGLDRLPNVRKVNWLQFVFTLITGLIWLIFLPHFVTLIVKIGQNLDYGVRWFQIIVFRWKIMANPEAMHWFGVWLLALAHTLFNLNVIILGFPFTLIGAKHGLPFLNDKVKIGSNGKTYLDRRALQSPPLALILASHEINQMATLSQEMLKTSRIAFLKGQVQLLNSIERDEKVIDDLQEQITFYLSALLSQNSLTETQSHRLAGLLHIVSDIERVADHANNLTHLAEKRYREQLPFSELALNEIELLFGKALDLYNKVCQALRDNNFELAKQIENREENIDKLEEELRQNHIHRLNQGRCWPGSGVIYVEMLSNLERVAAHSANIAAAILEEGEV